MQKVQWADEANGTVNDTDSLHSIESEPQDPPKKHASNSARATVLISKNMAFLALSDYSLSHIQLLNYMWWQFCQVHNVTVLTEKQAKQAHFAVVLVS